MKTVKVLFFDAKPYDKAVFSPLAKRSAISIDYLPARLTTFPNVILTSHQAFFTREALRNIAVTTLQNIRDFADGKPLVNGIGDNCVRPGCPQNKALSSHAER